MAGVAGALYLMRFRGNELLRWLPAWHQSLQQCSGASKLRGALVGGLLLGLIEMYGSAIFGSEWQHVVAFVVLVLVLMFRPTGILGESLAAGARMTKTEATPTY